MALNSRIASWITVAGILLTVTDVLVAQTELGNWQEITATAGYTCNYATVSIACMPAVAVGLGSAE